MKLQRRGADTPARETRPGRVAGARTRADFVEKMAEPVARFRHSRRKVR
jgi:hypothetical protein